jgi:hypothetical protein
LVQENCQEEQACDKRHNTNTNTNNNNNNNNKMQIRVVGCRQVSALPEGNICIALPLLGIAECILVYSDFYYEAETGLTVKY